MDNNIQEQNKLQLQKYIQSLLYPDDFLSGDMSLLPEKNYGQYIKHIIALQEYENLDPDDFFIDPITDADLKWDEFFSYGDAKRDAFQKIDRTEEIFVSQLEKDLSSVNIDLRKTNLSVITDDQKISNYLKSLDLPTDITTGNPALLPWQYRGLLEDYQTEVKKWADDPDVDQRTDRELYAFCSKIKDEMSRLNINTCLINDIKVDWQTVKPNVLTDKLYRDALVDARVSKMLPNRKDLGIDLPIVFKINDDRKLYISQLYNDKNGQLMIKINGEKFEGNYSMWSELKKGSPLQDIIVKHLGEQLGLKEHYQRYTMPKTYGILSTDYAFGQDLEGNCKMTISRPNGNTLVASLSIDDMGAFLTNIATHEQLAAKYLYNGLFEIKHNENALVTDRDTAYYAAKKQSTKNDNNIAINRTEEQVAEVKQEQPKKNAEQKIVYDSVAEQYQHLKLPKGVQFDNPQKQITLSKVSGTNDYMLTVDCPNGQKLETKLPYWDANAFFSKNASKEQLAAKFFSTDLAAMDWSKKPEQKQEVQKSMAMK